MSRPAKIGMALGGTLIFILVSLTILVKVVITPEKVRESLLPLIEETLQRKIDVGEVDISIFSGVSLSDLRVFDLASRDDFISVKSMSLNYKLLALLTGDLVIDQVLLEQPKIIVVRTADGQFNFSDLLNEQSDTVSSVPTVGGANGQPASSGSALNLLIKKISITGGELLFIDRLHNSKSPYRYTLDQVNFQARQITLDSSFPIEFSAQLNGSKIAVAGRYDIASQNGDLDMQLTALDLVQFAPYYRQALPGKLGSGSLTLNIEVQTQQQQVTSKGTVQFEQLDLQLSDFPDAPIQQAKLGVDYALTFNLDKQLLDISTLFVKLNESPIAIDGTVALGADEPELALTILFDKLDLRKLLQDLPAALTKELSPYSLAGQFDGRVDLVGRPSAGAKLVKSASFDLIDVYATIDTLRTGVSGIISYADQQAEAEKLLFSIADQQATLSFKASNILGRIITGDFKLAAAQLDLNNILPQKSQQQSSPVISASNKSPSVARKKTLADDIGPFNLPVAMTGSLSVGQLLYKDLTLDRVLVDLLLQDNHLQIKQLQSGVGGGQFTATADVDLGVKGLKYQGQMKLDQSQLVSIVSSFIPDAKQSVSGLLLWQNNFTGRGTLPDNLLEALQVKGVLQLQKGKISGSPLLAQLATFLGSPDLKVLSFETFDSRYDLHNGLANLSGQLNSSKAKLTPTGTVGVDGSLNLKLDARLAPELMGRLGAKLGLQQVVSDSDGWGQLPLTIKGSLTNPQVSFDSKALQGQAVDKLKEQATQKLLDKLGGDAGSNEPVKQLLNNTLNRLFGQ